MYAAPAFSFSSSDHIRILVYLALHPPSVRKIKQAPQKAKLPALPKPRGRKRNVVDDGADMQPPSPSECAAAAQVLDFYITTIPPVHVLRALPGYKELEGYVTPVLNPDAYDSAVAKRSLVLARKQDCADCWAMLREGFIPDPADAAYGAPMDTQEDGGGDVPPPVGRHAWLVLKWLVSAFEQDDRRRNASGCTSHAPSLLTLSLLTVMYASHGRSPLPLTDTANQSIRRKEWPALGMQRARARRSVLLRSGRAASNGSTSARTNWTAPPRHRTPPFHNSAYVHSSPGQTIKLSMPPKPGATPYLDPANLVRNVARRTRELPPDAFDMLFTYTASTFPHFTIAVLFLHIISVSGKSTESVFGGDGLCHVRPYARPQLAGIASVLVLPVARPSPGAHRRHMLAKAHLLRAAMRTARERTEASDQEWYDPVKKLSLRNAIRTGFSAAACSSGSGTADEGFVSEAALYCEQLEVLIDSLVK